MATKAKKKHHKHHHRASTSNRRHHKKRNQGPTRIVVLKPNKHRRRARNPQFFGTNVSPIKLATFVGGGLLGVTVNKSVLPMLPVSITGSNLYSTIAALLIAGGEWMLAAMVDKDFGAAVGFGALMNVASQALNAFVPAVGSIVSLSGRRSGVADFVPARFTIPENPVDISSGIAGPGGLMHGAYPSAYGRAA